MSKKEVTLSFEGAGKPDTDLSDPHTFELMRGRYSRFGSLFLTMVTFAILWLYIQKNLYVVLYRNGTYLDAVSTGITVSLSITATALLVAAFGQRPFFARLCSSRSTLLLGCVGTGSAALSYALFNVLPDSFPVAIGIHALLVVQSCLFCLLFLNWMSLVFDGAHIKGFAPTVVEVFLGIAAGHFLGHNGLNNTGFAAAIYIFGFAIIGLSYVFINRETKIQLKSVKVSTGSFAQVESPLRVLAGSDSKGCLTAITALIACIFLCAGLLANVSRFTDSFESGVEGSLSYFIPVIGLLIMIVVIQSVDHNEVGQIGSFVFFALGFIVIMFLALFITVFLLSTNGDISQDLIRLARRTFRILAFAIILILVYLYELDPRRMFGFLFLAPFSFAKFIQLLVLSVLPNFAPHLIGSDYVFALLICTGFAMVLCLIGLFALVVWIALRVSRRQKISEGEQRNTVNDTDLHEQMFRQIATDYALTERELDVLRTVSLGYSAQKIASTLSISVGTVNTYSASLYTKLGVHKKQEVIDFVDEKLKNLPKEYPM